MKNTTRRIRQVLIGILAVLSMSVSAVAACTCSHHHSEAQPSNSCHGDNHKPPQDNSEDTNVGAPRVTETCVCMQPGSKLSVKGESFKLKKLPAASASAPPLTSEATEFVEASPGFAFEQLHHVSPSLGSTHARGPPRS